MIRLIVLTLTLSFSMLLGVDTPKELESNPQSLNSPEITLDIENVQQVRQMKAGMNKLFKQARKATSHIPKPESFQKNKSATTPKPDFEKYTRLNQATPQVNKKSFKETINQSQKKDKQALKDAYLERRATAKQKRDEFRAREEARRLTRSMMGKSESNYDQTKSIRDMMTLSGIVHNQGGSPISGATVKAAWSIEDNVEATTDDNGYYELEINENDFDNCILTAEKLEWDDVWNTWASIYRPSNRLPMDGGTTDFELHATADLAFLSIVAQDDEGFSANKIPFAWVEWYHPDLEYGDEITNYDGEAFAIIYPTDPTSYEECEFMVSKEGYQDGYGSAVDLYGWISGSGLGGATVVCYPDDTPDEPYIEGIVRGFNGNPIGGVDLNAERMDGYWSSASTDEGGYYHMELDTAGFYRVVIEGGEYFPDMTMVNVPESGTQYDFMLGHHEETALLEIYTMSEDNGDSVPYAELESPQSPQGMSVSDWDGLDYITVEAPIDFAEVFGWHPEFGDGYGSSEDWGFNPGDEYYMEVFFGGDPDDDFTFLGEFEGHEYWISNFEETWWNARELLDEFEGVHLVTITSQEESDFLTEVFQDELYWIGMTDEINEGEWEWVTGEEVDFTNWYESQPDDFEGQDYAISNYMETGFWDDANGEFTSRFIAEAVAEGGETGMVYGVVFDHEERPVDSAMVVFFSEIEEINVLAEEGEFSVELPQGDWSAYAYSENEEDNLWFDLWAGGVLYVEPGSESYIDFALFPMNEYGFLIAHVAVIYEDGNTDPMAEIWVTVSDSVGNTHYEGATNIWGDMGQAFLPGEYLVQVETEFGYQEQYVTVDTADIWWLEFYFEMDNNEDYGWIEGYVNEPGGSPIMDAWVNAWNYDYWEGTWTDEDGYYQMEVPAGYYEMEAGADGYSTDWTDVNVFPNEGSWVYFGLNWEENYSIVSGQVTDIAGDLIPFALVNASYLYDEWESEGSFTDSSGYYELYLQEGDYRISAGAEGYWVSAYDSVHIGDTTNYWLPFVLENVESFDGAWEGNINLVGNYDPGMIYLGIMSEDYQVFRILWEPGPQEVELVNGTYHVFAGAEGYQEVFMPNAIQIENNVVNFDIFLIEEGLVLPPQINWAGDVPNDQGRQMRLVWNPGMPGDWQYFPFYSIWRHVNEAPQNLWDYIATVPWHGMEPYSAVVPTLGDSTDMGIYWSTFRITAHTEDPMVFYDSQPVTGYSVDNISPNAPGGVQAFTGNDGVIVSWDPPLEEDFGYHRIYRHDLDSEDPAEEFTTVDTFFVDNLTEGNYEYWVTTVDINGNESNPSEAVTVLLAIDDGLAIPTEFALQQNYPNPFNPSTQIQYALPTDANVSITIYDVMGREVRSLVNKTVSAGYHSTLWNATNDLGSPVAAGVYIYAIQAGEFRSTKKMILLK